MVLIFKILCIYLFFKFSSIININLRMKTSIINLNLKEDDIYENKEK